MRTFGFGALAFMGQAIPTAAATAPAAFTAGQWTLQATNLTITALPSNGGSAITDLEYRIGAGAAVSLSATTTGTYAHAGAETNDIQIRAVNAIGAGDWSDTKAVPAASSGVSPVFRGTSTVSSFGGTHNHTAPVSLASGQKYVIACGWEGDAATVGLTVNGTAATVRAAEFNIGAGHIKIFEVTPASSGTTVVLTATTGNFALASAISYVEVDNASTFEAAISDNGTVDNEVALSLNVGANDSLIAMAWGINATSVTWVGATQAGSTTIDSIFASCAIAEDVTAATPRTVTGTRVGTVDTNDFYVGSLVRYSA